MPTKYGERMAHLTPTFVKTDSPSTLMVLVDYDPGGDYDHHKTFLLLTFENQIDKDLRERVKVQLRKTPQAYVPDARYPDSDGDISNIVTMRNVIAACAEVGAPVATVRMVDGYTYLDAYGDGDRSATPGEVNKSSDHGTYAVDNTGAPAPVQQIPDHQTGETFNDIREALADPEDPVDAVFNLIVDERRSYWDERLATVLGDVETRLGAQDILTPEKVMQILRSEFIA